MPRQAITFDFHDTLVHCDAWFQLEIRTLPSEFLKWHTQELGGFAPESVGASLDQSYRKLRTAIIEHGHELTSEKSLETILELAGYVVPFSDIAQGVNALMAAALESATPVDGAVETVRSLSVEGIPLGVVSSAVHHPFLEWALDRFGIHQNFGAIVTSASSGYYKSRPEIYGTALEQLQVDADRSVHVGDSARYDVEGAARAGMKTVWLRRSGAIQPAIAPDLTLETLIGSTPQLLNLYRVAAD